MGVNRGKQFEDIIRENFEKVLDTSVDRLHDQTTYYKGSTNICDFIVYRYPYQFYIECKSTHSNTLSIFGNDPKHKYGNITNRQWEGLLEKSNIPGVYAGVICWWIKNERTLFIPIKTLESIRNFGGKSISCNINAAGGIVELQGKKKRVFYEYDIENFFREVTNANRECGFKKDK